MSGKIKISIIVPVYNAEEYIRKCVDSIRNQTHKNIEIILVNDGSKDNSGEICDLLAQEDQRIIVIHKENGGQSSARNLGIDNATGEYIGFVDSDDYIDKDMFHNMLQSALKENADIVQIGHYVVNNQGEVVNIQKREKESFTELHALLEANVNKGIIVPSICDKLFYYKLWDGLRMEEGYYYEDGMVLLHLLRRASKVFLLDDIGYYYVLSKESTQRGPFNIKHVESCLFEPNYYYNYFKTYAPEFISYGFSRACFRAMRGFRFLESIREIKHLEKMNYRDKLINMFKSNYPIFKKTSRYRELSTYQKIALHIFSINPNLYLKFFFLLKK